MLSRGGMVDPLGAGGAATAEAMGVGPLEHLGRAARHHEPRRADRGVELEESADLEGGRDLAVGDGRGDRRPALEGPRLVHVGLLDAERRGIGVGRQLDVIALATNEQAARVNEKPCAGRGHEVLP